MVGGLLLCSAVKLQYGSLECYHEIHCEENVKMTTTTVQEVLLHWSDINYNLTLSISIDNFEIESPSRNSPTSSLSPPASALLLAQRKNKRKPVQI